MTHKLKDVLRRQSYRMVFDSVNAEGHVADHLQTKFMCEQAVQEPEVGSPSIFSI